MTLKHRLIFIVDDDDEDRFMLCQAFQKHHPDCLLFTFSNGQELLDHLTDYYDMPDLIILDLNMPVMNGLTTLKYLKRNSRLSQIPTVILGSFFETSEELQNNELESYELLIKPSCYSELVQLTNHLCPV